jgi:hypothetical protein
MIVSWNYNIYNINIHSIHITCGCGGEDFFSQSKPRITHGGHAFPLRLSIIFQVDIAKKRLTAKAEAGLVSSLVLLRHLIPQLADKTLMDILKV